jgi:hypothetical protein
MDIAPSSRHCRPGEGAQMEDVTAYDPNLVLGRLLISIGHSVAIVQELVEHLGTRLEEQPPGEWHHN